MALAEISSSVPPQKNLYGAQISVDRATISDAPIDEEKKDLLVNIHGEDRLNPVMLQLVNRGVVADAKEGIEYVANLITSPVVNPRDVSLSPTAKRRPSPLDAFKPKPAERFTVPLYLHGSLGHSAVSDFTSGKSIREAEKYYDEQSQEPESSQPALGYHDSKKEEPILVDGKLTDRYLNRLAGVLAELNHNGGEPHTIYPNSTRLTEMLRPLFPGQVKRLLLDQHIDPYRIQTLRSWGQIVLAGQGSFGPVFNEMQIFDRSKTSNLGPGPNAGRIDGVIFETADGHPLTKEEQEKINEERFEKHRTAAHTEASLELRLKRQFNPQIVDYKFYVGDGLRPNEPLPEDVLNDPPSKHISQVLTYLTLADIASYIMHQNIDTDFPRQHMFSDTSYTRGLLKYFYPDREPFTFEINANPDIKAKFFYDVILPRYEKAVARAKYLRTEKMIAEGVRYVIGDLGTATSASYSEEDLEESHVPFTFRDVIELQRAA